MRLLLTDDPYRNIIDEAAGAGAKPLILTSATSDGVYYSLADFYTTMSSTHSRIKICTGLIYFFARLKSIKFF
jgi:hypothetical protein